jgi:hypothetical protein
MKYIICLLLLSGCGAAYLPAENEHFKVIEARSFQVQEPGQQQAVTNYNFKLYITTRQKLAFDTVWVRNQGYPVKVSKTSLDQADLAFSLNDTLVLRATNRQRTPDPVEESSYETPPRPPVMVKGTPVRYKGQALLRYYIDGVSKYHPIAGIETDQPR